MDFLKLAQTRQSIRSFTEQPVTESQLDTLLQSAIAAPSAGNRQAWHFVVVRSPELKVMIANDAAHQPWIGTASVVLVVCADPSANADRYAERGEHLYALQDTAAAIQNILLCAVTLGLGTCWCGGFDEDAAARILVLPAHLRPIAIVPIGHPATPLPKPNPRRPIAEVVTFR